MADRIERGLAARERRRAGRGGGVHDERRVRPGVVEVTGTLAEKLVEEMAALHKPRTGW